MIVIIYADVNEEVKIKEKTKKTSFSQFNGLIFKISKLDILLVRSGVGTTQAAACTQAVIDKFKPKAIYNYGAVGGSNKVKPLQIIIPDGIYYHDAITPWYPRGQVPGQPAKFKNLLNSNKKINIATGNEFIHSQEKVNKIKNELNVDIFDMEAAAIAHVCCNNKVPFGTIKCVSDIIGHTNIGKNNINELINNAAKKAFDKLITILLK